MTRDLKFRSWDIQQKHMDITLATDMHGSPRPTLVVVNVTDAGFELPQDKFILMQYTGLKDKNGKEIYEGDILLMQLPFFKSRDSYEGIVKFKDGCFIVTDVIDTEYREPYKTYLQFSIVYLDELFKCLETEYVSNYGEVCKTKTEHLVYAEVIGNIYENPELLTNK